VLVTVSVVFYISGHGFGHASRQIEVINALAARRRSLPVQVVTSVARRLFDRTVVPPFELHARACDTGVAQLDSLHLDTTATIARAAEFHRALPSRTAAEATWLAEVGARLVVGDIPPLAFTAAAAAGVPAVAHGNFSWDWIYSGYAAELAEAPDLVPVIAHAYGQATVAWRMPIGGGFTNFARVIDVPMVARHARRGRDDVRRTLRLPMDRPVALVSFGDYGLDSPGFASLDCTDRWTIVLTAETADRPVPGNRRGVRVIVEDDLYRHALRYEDLVGAADVVVTKPGYGILSECIANGAAMLYTSRGPFAEYDALVAAMPRYARSRFLDQPALLAGRWGDALDALLDQPPPPERLATNGSAVAAEMILELIG
jgi:L-arabinokinase